MKKHWLRGVLLGVSLALLLAGGVAVANGLYATPDQPCFQCQPRAAGWPPPTADRILVLTIGGYDMADYLCARLTMAGVVWDEGCGPLAHSPPCSVGIAVLCETMEVLMGQDCWGGGNAEVLGGDVGPAQLPDAVYGQWVWRMWQEEGANDNLVTAGPVFAGDLRRDGQLSRVPLPDEDVLSGGSVLPAGHPPGPPDPSLREEGDPSGSEKLNVTAETVAAGVQPRPSASPSYAVMNHPEGIGVFQGLHRCVQGVGHMAVNAGQPVSLGSRSKASSHRFIIGEGLIGSGIHSSHRSVVHGSLGEGRSQLWKGLFEHFQEDVGDALAGFHVSSGHGGRW